LLGGYPAGNRLTPVSAAKTTVLTASNANPNRHEVWSRVRRLMTTESPPDATTFTVLVLVRHGETLGNREGRFQTYGTPLSDTGRTQASRLAERIAAEHRVRAIYTSDLTRALETATIIGDRLGLTPIPDRAFRELDVGDWKGLLRPDVMEQFPGGFDGWLADGGREPLPGAEGECCDDVARRTRGGFDEIIARHPGEQVLVVSHGLALAILLGEIHGWDRAETLRTQRAAQGNTAVNIVEADLAGMRRCTLLGCTAHLAGASPTPSPSLATRERDPHIACEG
jgi:broad specificity phosphatase PhoE